MAIPYLLARRSTAGPALGMAAWASAWLGGHTGTDDVVAALGHWAQVHTVDGGLPGLLLELRRSAPTAVRLLLPAPGDPAGLPAGTAAERAALARGEAVGFDGAGSSLLLVPTAESADVVAWTSFRVAPALVDRDPITLGEAEYALRDAVRDATSALAALPPEPGAPSAHAAVAELAQHLGATPLPAIAGARAHRVLDTAATVEAILLVAGERHPDAGIGLGGAQRGDAAYSALARAVRSARTAAIDSITRDALR
ncbi:hypothetical protein P0W64_08965 [Tsukamurella sp. 8F]|uniref:hypothetical protein n=1 Tax=unclassified Tsukamurella TaxID=2633480 RepID=UPI0023BA043C|nr:MULTISPECIES: hypothetical protein [unclassified Tsukamurella]MDF0529262.1 hypothetical protein [Tsukamurella sp. 8J]MDF0586901.1 hypothetical protein [Tsukamurella sp. 8F]